MLKPADRVLLTESTAQDDREIGFRRPKGAERRQAVHARHGEVEQHEADASGVGGKHLEGLCPVTRHQRLAPGSHQRALAHGADALLVVHDEYGPSSSGCPRGPAVCAATLGTKGQRRQQDADPCSGPGCAVDQQGALVRADDAADRRHAEPAAQELRRVEGIPQSLEGHVIHALAGIADLEPHVGARLGRALDVILRQERFVALHHAGRDNHSAVAVADRLGTVGHQVHHDLLQLPGIRLHAELVGGQLQGELDVLRDGGSKQVSVVGEEVVEVDLLHQVARLTRVGEQLARECRSALRGGNRVLEVGGGRFPVLHVEQGQFDVAEHHGQQVVEIVRDAACQDAETLELLCLQQPTFHLEPPLLVVLAVRDVLVRTNHAGRHAVRVAGDDLPTRQQPPPLATACPPAGLHRKDRVSAGQGTAEHVVYPLGIVGVDLAVGPRCGQCDSPGIEVQHFVEPRAPPQALSQGFPIPHPVAGGLEREPQAFLASCQRVDRAAPFGRVVGEVGHRPHHLDVLFQIWSRRVANPHDGDDECTPHDRHDELAVDGGVAGREPLATRQRRVVVVNRGLATPDTIGPDASLVDRVVRALALRLAHVCDGVRRPRLQRDRLLIRFQEVEEGDLARRERLRLVQRMLDHVVDGLRDGQFVEAQASLGHQRGAALRGDVGARADEAGERPDVVGEGREGLDHPAVVAVVTTEAMLGLPELPMLDGVSHPLVDPGAIVVVHARQPAVAHSVGKAASGERHPAFVREQATAAEVEDRNGIRIGGGRERGATRRPRRRTARPRHSYGQSLAHRRAPRVPRVTGRATVYHVFSV